MPLERRRGTPHTVERAGRRVAGIQRIFHHRGKEKDVRAGFRPRCRGRGSPGCRKRSETIGVLQISTSSGSIVGGAAAQKPSLRPVEAAGRVEGLEPGVPPSTRPCPVPTHRIDARTRHERTPLFLGGRNAESGVRAGRPLEEVPRGTDRGLKTPSHRVSSIP